MNTGIEFARKMSFAYAAMCKPLCHELNLPQTAFDILMFLANNPEYTTARDIVEIRKLKANLVSINIEKLVKDGYLIRKEVKGDRRKTQLICTPKAETIIEKGHLLQKTFLERLFINMDDSLRQAFVEGMHQMEKNLDFILEEER